MIDILNKGRRNHLIILGFTLLLLIIKFNNVIIFENAITNLNLNFVIYFCLFTLFLNSFLLKQIWAKIISALVFGSICTVGLIIMLFTLSDIDNVKRNGGQDSAMECINNISINNTNIKAYRTDGGMTTDFGIIVREEKSLYGGLLYTNTLYRKYHMDTIILNIMNNNTLILTDSDGKFLKKIEYK